MKVDFCEISRVTSCLLRIFSCFQLLGATEIYADFKQAENSWTEMFFLGIARENSVF